MSHDINYRLARGLA